MSYSSTSSVIINAPIEKVWDALTKPELVKQYFFGTNLVTTWEVGTPILFKGEWEGKSYEDKGTVLEFSPLNTLSYNYFSPLRGTEDTPENYQILRYTLEKKPDGIEVSIIQTEVESQEKADHSANNWKMVLEGLKKLLES